MFGSLVPGIEDLLFHGIWKLLTTPHWPFPSAVSAQHFCKSGLRVSNQETGKLEDAANDPLWKIWFSKMGTIAKEIWARDCTRIKFFRRAHFNCSAYVRFLLHPLQFCCLLGCAALEKYDGTVGSCTLQPDMAKTTLCTEWENSAMDQMVEKYAMKATSYCIQKTVELILSNRWTWQPFPISSVLWKLNNYLTMISNIRCILKHIQEASKDIFLKKSENMALHNSQAGDIEVWDKKRNMVISLVFMHKSCIC